MRQAAGKIRLGRLIAGAILSAAAAWFIGKGSILLQTAYPMQQHISLICNAPLTSSEIERMRGEAAGEAAQFTAWTEQGDAVISVLDGCRSMSATVLLLDGSSELLLPYGKILHEDDATGCLIGEKTAMRLFGNVNAEGLTLWYAGRALTVRGVLRAVEDLMVVQAEAETEFDRIMVRAEKGTPKEITVERFVANSNIAAEQIRYDLLAAEYLLLLVPGRWSDFDALSGVWNRVGEDIKRLLSTQKSSLEITYYRQCGTGAANTVLGVIMLFAAVWHGKKAYKR